MKDLVFMFCRGFLIVALISLKRIQLSQGCWAAPFVGFCIAVVWWVNARTASKVDGILAVMAYASGSACGTAMGLWLGGLSNGAF